MELINKLKRVFIAMTLVIVLIAGSSGSAQTYEEIFSEDFSNPDLPNWEFQGWGRTTADGPLYVREPNLEVIDGELAVTNPPTDPEMLLWNDLVYDQDIHYGNWSMDYFHGCECGWNLAATNVTAWEGMRPNDFDERIEGFGWRYYPNDNYVDFQFGRLVPGDNVTVEGTLPESLNEKDKWYHFEFVLHPNYAQLIVDDTVYLDVNLTGFNSEREISKIRINMWAGAAGSKWDNFVIEEYIPLGSTNTTESIDLGITNDLPWQYLAIGATLGTMAIVAGWGRGKKN